MEKFNKLSKLYYWLQYINQTNSQIIMKLGLALFLTLTSLFISGQCRSQCDVVQNGSFTNNWSNWSRQTGWGISTYGGNSTSATNVVDNSPASGYSIQQTINAVGGTKLWRLTFDAYAQSPNPGIAYLDFFLDNTRFVRLVNSASGSGVTSVLYNGAIAISTSNWSFSTWKRDYTVDIPWVSNDSSVVLKITYISNGSLRDWGVDNIRLCRYQTLDLTEVKYAQVLDSVKFQFTKNKEDLVEIFSFDHLTGKSEYLLATYNETATIQHTSKYYFIKSGSYRKFIGPFELISDEPKKVLSTKQLLGQFTN